MLSALANSKRVRGAVAPAFGFAVVAYLAYQGVYGDRGVLALNHLQLQTAKAEATLLQIREERLELERRTMLLRPDGLDLDMLEERARALLNYAHPDDLVIFDAPAGAADPGAP